MDSIEELMHKHLIPSLRNWERPQIETFVNLYGETNQGHQSNMATMFQKFDAQYNGKCTTNRHELRHLLLAIRKIPATAAGKYFLKWTPEQDTEIARQH